MALERSPVIQGLTRQAVQLGLPLPYLMAWILISTYPFFLTGWLWWPFTSVFWYGIARTIIILNPRAHVVVFIVLRKTFPKIFNRKAGRRYVL